MDILLNGTKGCPSTIILRLDIVVVTVLLSYNSRTASPQA